MTTPDTTDTPAGAAPPEGTRAHRLRWWTLAVIAIAQLMVILDTSIVNIALPSAQQGLGFSDASRQWIVTAYALAFGSLLLLGGRLADLFGRKVTFLVGLAGFALASAVGGAAVNFAMLVTARTVQGLFAALLAPTALALVATTFRDPAERGKAFGIFGALGAAGGAIGLLLGGLLTQSLDWRWCLYVNLVFVVVAFVGGLVLLERNETGERPKLDLTGTVLVSLGLFAVVLGFADAESEGWGSPATWGVLVAGAVLLVAFVLWQRRAPSPLLPLRVLLDRNRGASFLALLIAGVGMFGATLFLTYYLQLNLGYSPIMTGVAFLPMVVAIVIASTLAAGILAPRFGPKPVVPVGMALAALAFGWLTTLDLDSGYLALLPGLVVLGLGLGAVMSTAISMATGGVAETDAGAASAAVNTVQQIGGSIGTALLNTIALSAAASYLATHDGAGEGPRAAVHSYAAAYSWSAGLFVIGVVVTALLYRRERRTVSAPDAADSVAA
ncbi:DHA2 family efflux MFS transporter permease subunit [Amycolatopsis pithecellobii]|uniref:DHA2 family efflux MFS transporter permease subunit n=1 Tax=Amycolatopsis pithecellobii TaxID=664692 RepID=A0A6N7YNI9_9PSEU|nr:DHA2 family efflux MFS transporter permease subunit [Amycolatopsis pithecellobii]MTD54545.1 DHA2 family efflux MFS transporter permease subunit [Amycolatopsis pithecellobii]